LRFVFDSQYSLAKMKKPFGLADKSLSNSQEIESLTIQDALYLPNGSVSLPSLAFGNDLDCGIYRIGANNLGIAVNATKILDIATTGLSITGNIAATGTIGGLTSAELSQLANIGANTISSTQWGYVSAMDQSLTTGSTVGFDGVISNNSFYAGYGTAALPAYTWGSGNGINSGLYYESTGTGKVLFSTDSTERGYFNSSGLTVSNTNINGSTIALSGTTGNNKISIVDNLASALDITESTNSYIKLITTNSSEKVEIGKNLSLLGQLSSSVQSLVIYRHNTNYTVNDSTGTVLALSTAITSRGSDISYASGVFTINTAGTYLFSYYIPWEAYNTQPTGTTGAYLGYWEDNAIVRYAANRSYVNTTIAGSVYEMTGTCVRTCAVNDTMRVVATQSSGNTQRTYWAATYIYPTVACYRLC
jgi:hypothetical protein